MKYIVNLHTPIALQSRTLQLRLLNVLLMLTGLLFISTSSFAQITGVTWEVDTAFYEPTTFDAGGEPIFAELEGFLTYKLFAEFTNPDDELSAIYSDAAVLGTPPFYVNAPCGCFNPALGNVLLGGNLNEALFDFFPSVAYDTFWTLGFANGEQSALGNPNYNMSTMCQEEENSGLIFTVEPVAAGDDLRIQFAQITTCGSFEFHACFQVFINGNQAPYQEWCMDGDGGGPVEVNSPCDTYATTDAEIAVTSTIDCFGDLAAVDVNVNGALPMTYELFNAADSSLVATQIDNNSFADLPEGEYFVAIMDGNTCRDSSDVFEFIEPEELVASWELLADNVCPGDMGSIIEIDYSGGSGPFDIVAFSAENVGSGEYPDGNNQWVGLDCVNGNGEWLFEIQDFYGCDLDTSIAVTCIEPLELEVASDDISCYSYGDGMIEGFMSGGTGVLTLAGSPNLGTNISGEGTVNFTVTDLEAADYLLVASDENGCEVESGVSIVEPDPVTIELTVTDLPLCRIMRWRSQHRSIWRIWFLRL